MASFSFGAGNAGKLLRVPLYIAGRIMTLVIPRSRDLWVFGCAVGLADGAWALWVHAADRGERAVWLTGSDAELTHARSRGVRAVPKDSWRGFWLTARAAVIVVTHGFGDVNRYAATGGVIVQLWHGIPLKRIGLDAAVTTQSPLPFARTASARLLALLYRRTQRRIDVLPAASEIVRGRLESAFGLASAHVPVTGEPRVDVLSQGSEPNRRHEALGRVVDAVGDVPDGARIVLYAPTWRDGAEDPAVPHAADIAAIGELLTATDAILLIRSHPLGAGDYAAAAGTRVRMLGSDLVADVTPLLPAVDVLVTDYSSLAFDASLVPVPTIFFAPDLVSYERSRGFYGTYAELTGGLHASTWPEVVAQLRDVLTEPEEVDRLTARARALSDRVHTFDDGRNTERVYHAIRRQLPQTERVL